MREDKPNLAERMMKRVVIDLFLMLGIVVVLVLVVMPMVSNRYGVTLLQDEDSDISVESERMNVEFVEELGYVVSITGNLSNSSTKTYGNITLMYKLYDEAGNELGMAAAVVNEVMPNSTIEYEAGATAVLSTRPHSYTLTNIVGA